MINICPSTVVSVIIMNSKLRCTPENIFNLLSSRRQLNWLKICNQTYIVTKYHVPALADRMGNLFCFFLGFRCRRIIFHYLRCRVTRFLFASPSPEFVLFPRNCFCFEMCQWPISVGQHRSCEYVISVE
jgi:hypothetical protein